jgi:hypothetical protein
LKSLGIQKYVPCLFVLALVILPRKHFACSICGEYLLEEYAIHACFISILSTFWTIFLYIYGCKMYQKICNDEPELDPQNIPSNIPNGKAIMLSFPLVIAAIVLFSNRCIFPYLAIAAYLNVISFVFPYFPQPLPILDWLSIRMRRLNWFYLSIMVLLGITFLNYVTSVNGILDRAEKNYVFDNIHIAKELISKKDKVVDLLIPKIEKEINEAFTYAKKGIAYLYSTSEDRLSLYVFVIGKVGNIKAKECLTQIIKNGIDRPENHKNPDADWRHMAVYAYADCCGHKAVPLLLDLYKEFEPYDKLLCQTIRNALMSIGGDQIIEEELMPYLRGEETNYHASMNISAATTEMYRNLYLYKPYKMGMKNYSWQKISQEIDKHQGR